MAIDQRFQTSADLDGVVCGGGRRPSQGYADENGTAAELRTMQEFDSAWNAS